MRSETATKLLSEVNVTYESIADAFDRTRNTMWEDFEPVREHLPQGPLRLLDVGCGNGRLLTAFESQDFVSYVGVDASRTLLGHARRRHSGASIRFKVGDQLRVPASSGSSNAVFSLAALHHVPSRVLQKQALLELARVVTPDGVVVVSVWDLYRWRMAGIFIRSFFRWIVTFGDYSIRDVFVPWGKSNPVNRYCHAFTLPELTRLMKESGFEILAAYTARQKRLGNHWVVARPFLASRSIEIQQVPIHRVTLDEAVRVAGQFLKSKGQHRIFTPNPEILLKAEQDRTYRAVLRRAALNLPDGVGLLWAAYVLRGNPGFLLRLGRGFLGFLWLIVDRSRLSKGFPVRVTGTDFMEALTHQAHRFGAKVFLLGAAPGVAEAVAERWRFDPIVGTYSGSPKPRDEQEILKRIQASGATLLFVAFGAPAQEQWIDRNLHKLSNVRVAVGVGGAFDFFAGVRRRAPQSMQRFGLEWLWRLAQEPRRWRRILNATVVFPWRVISGR